MNQAAALEIKNKNSQFLFCNDDAYDTAAAAAATAAADAASDSTSMASKSTTSDEEEPTLVKTTTVAVAAPNWGFKGECGPSEWHKYFPHAAGKKQSPVDIPSEQAVYSEKLAAAPFSINYDDKCTSKIENTGRIFVVTGDSPNSVVTGGPAEAEYKFLQFHMHWGADNSGGSEHTIDGKPYVAEMHFVNWNHEQHADSNIASYVNDHTGLMVFGVLLTLGADNPEIEKLIHSLDSIKLAQQSAPVAEPFNLNRLFPADKSSYYHYLGSLTMPPCTECIKWIVFKTPVEVSARQMDHFRQLYMCPSAGECCEETRMSSNVRPVCPLNGRTVFKSFN